jgi:predicted secreted Zn-dependent protease
MRPFMVLAVAVIAGLASIPAEARPQSTTKYQYYSINGNSALEVYKSMLNRGPRVNGAKAYAATSAQSSQAGFLVQGQSCRIRNYRVKIDFVIKLPRMTNEGRLPPLIRSKWQQFSTFLKKHEETHRAIWMGCAKEFEGKIASLKSGDCDSLDTQAAQLWDKIRTACDRKHAAFDAAQQKLLVKHPFVKLVLGTEPPVVATASIDTKKRKKTAAALADY